MGPDQTLTWVQGAPGAQPPARPHTREHVSHLILFLDTDLTSEPRIPGQGEAVWGLAGAAAVLFGFTRASSPLQFILKTELQKIK